VVCAVSAHMKVRYRVEARAEVATMSDSLKTLKLDIRCALPAPASYARLGSPAPARTVYAPCRSDGDSTSGGEMAHGLYTCVSSPSLTCRARSR
jgi:hypothetical protein